MASNSFLSWLKRSETSFFGFLVKFWPRKYLEKLKNIALNRPWIFPPFIGHLSSPPYGFKLPYLSFTIVKSLLVFSIFSKFYHSKGFRDVEILNKDSKLLDNQNIDLDIVINEGHQYFFGDITWLGNKKYDSEKLTEILGIVVFVIGVTILLISRV